MAEPTNYDNERRRADHYQQLYEAASDGNCGHSGMTLRECKASICDCFDFAWLDSEAAADA